MMPGTEPEQEHRTGDYQLGRALQILDGDELTADDKTEAGIHATLAVAAYVRDLAAAIMAELIRGNYISTENLADLLKSVMDTAGTPVRFSRGQGHLDPEINERTLPV